MFGTKSLHSGIDLNLNKLILPSVVMLAFLTLGTFLWRSSGQLLALFFFG